MTRAEGLASADFIKAVGQGNRTAFAKSTKESRKSAGASSSRSKMTARSPFPHRDQTKYCRPKVPGPWKRSNSRPIVCPAARRRKGLNDCMMPSMQETSKVPETNQACSTRPAATTASAQRKKARFIVLPGVWSWRGEISRPDHQPAFSELRSALLELGIAR